MARLKVNRTSLKPRARQQAHPSQESADGSAHTRLATKKRGVAAGSSAPAPPPATAGPPLAPATDQASFDITQKIKELVRLAQEQGYLTYSDITDALPDDGMGPEELDDIYLKLRNLDVEIVDQAEVDVVQAEQQIDVATQDEVEHIQEVRKETFIQSSQETEEKTHRGNS